MGAKVALNGLGHRNPDLASPKPANEFRIHVIGSSIAMGWGVQQERTFTALLERRLNDGGSGERRFRLINAGVGNYNVRYSVELLKRQIDVTHPDLVVLQYYINDAEGSPTRRDNELVKYSYFFAMLYVRLKSMLQLMAGNLTDYYGNLYRDGNPGWEDAVKALRELESLTRRRGIDLVALLVPEIHDLSDDSPYPPIYRQIGKTFDALDIPLVSAYEPFRQRFGNDPSGAWIAWDDPHPSAEGHEVMAKVLYQEIKDILISDGAHRR
jgi:lysophospholipase L1-like esterase